MPGSTTPLRRGPTCGASGRHVTPAGAIGGKASLDLEGSAIGLCNRAGGLMSEREGEAPAEPVSDLGNATARRSVRRGSPAHSCFAHPNLGTDSIPTTSPSECAAAASARTAFRDSLTRFCSSTAMTLTASLSPTRQTSVTFLTYPSESSLIWHRPSLPGAISMKAPKSLTELTVPS